MIICNRNAFLGKQKVRRDSSVIHFLEKMNRRYYIIYFFVSGLPLLHSNCRFIYIISDSDRSWVIDTGK